MLNIICIYYIMNFIIYIKNLTYLFSPASASYDQFKNFVERGDKFKDLVKYHAKRFN